MKKAMMLLAAVATSCAPPAWGAAILAAVVMSATLRVVGEVIWPGGNVKVVTGNCAKTEVKDGVVYVTSTESPGVS